MHKFVSVIDTVYHYLLCFYNMMHEKRSLLYIFIFSIYTHIYAKLDIVLRQLPSGYYVISLIFYFFTVH